MKSLTLSLLQYEIAERGKRGKMSYRTEIRTEDGEYKTHHPKAHLK
jgi:hypothetical protein